jgi:hypothetical protein
VSWLGFCDIRCKGWAPEAEFGSEHLKSDFRGVTGRFPFTLQVLVDTKERD